VALNLSERASARSASLVHREMRRGLNSLASISATAVFIGSIGTVLSIASLFTGGSTERNTLVYSILDGLSLAMVPTALGIVVALLAFCCYKHLLADIETLDFEMENAFLQLVNDLARLPSTNI
jgi:biopolymer transport protein ExbB